MKPLLRELRAGLRGEVTDREEELERFSTDESIFELRPLAVAAPRDEADVRAALGIAARHRVPVTARGGGTSTAGQAIGSGLVLDFTKHCSRILSVSETRAVVQPGVLLDDLNAELRKRGRWFPPDPSSRARCTLGGMLANNASGPRTFRYGDMRRYVRRARLVLADGSTAESGALAGKFDALASELRAARGEIERHRKPVRKNSSGYFLEGAASDPPEFTSLLVGSEGTLALATEIEVETAPLPARTHTLLLPFDSMEQAVEALSRLRSLGAAAIELIDRHILEALSRVDRGFAPETGLEGKAASLWVEWEGDPPSAARRPGALLIEGSAKQQRLWKLRSEASGHLQKQEGNRRPLRCIEDGVVPPERLGEYLGGLRELLRLRDCDGAIFGHAGDAHIHVNPMIDIAAPDLEGRIGGLMEDWYRLIEGCGGSISGEHGDGLLRRGLAARQWAGLLPLYRKVKEAFDPKGILNPDKKLASAGAPLPSLRDVRLPGCLARKA